MKWWDQFRQEDRIKNMQTLIDSNRESKDIEVPAF